MRLTSNSFWLIMALFVLPALISTTPTNGQQRAHGEDVLRKQIEPVSVTAHNFKIILGELALRYDVPMGLENPVGSAENEQGPNAIKAFDVGQVLDAVIVISPHYRWTLVDKVVNVSPVTNREPILNVVIHDFTVNNLTTSDVIDFMLNTREVRTAISQMNLRRDDTKPIPSEEPREARRLSFHLREASVRDILNYLLRNTKNRYWSIHRLNGDLQSFAILVW